MKILVDVAAQCAYLLINETGNNKQTGDEMAKDANYYYELSERHLVAANKKSEKGDDEKAEALYEKAEKALARANELAGN